MKKKWYAALASLAVVLLLTGRAWAYFTAYTTAEGAHPVHLGSASTVTERLSNWTKHVSIANEEGSEPVFVRARAFAGSVYELTYGDAAGLWRDGGDGWWYYAPALESGAVTGELEVYIGGVPEQAEEGDNFHVVVVYETTPVLYSADGAAYADWTAVLERGENE